MGDDTHRFPLRFRLVAWFARRVSPGYGACQRCRMPWTFVEHHTVEFWRSENGRASRGAFALCERCWNETGHGERLRAFYAVHGDRDKDWPLIEEALADA